MRLRKLKQHVLLPLPPTLLTPRPFQLLILSSGKSTFDLLLTEFRIDTDPSWKWIASTLAEK